VRLAEGQHGLRRRRNACTMIVLINRISPQRPYYSLLLGSRQDGCSISQISTLGAFSSGREG
jgi:hypothetical protein